jgi:glutaredoxin 3
MKHVRIYTTSYCGFCARAKELLLSQGVAFEELDVTDDNEMREKLVEMSGGRRTVPQIFFGDEHVGGYADLVRLKSEGRLSQMLE